jgi:hypothetical protein
VNYGYGQFSADAGDIVEVTLDQQANVFLLDSGDYSNFRNGQSFRYIGGLAVASPVRLRVPSSGSWYAVVDPRGGSVRYGIRVFRHR